MRAARLLVPWSIALLLLLAAGCGGAASPPGATCGAPSSGTEVTLTASNASCESQLLAQGAVLVAYDQNISAISEAGVPSAPDTDQDEGSNATAAPAASFDPVALTFSGIDPDDATYAATGTTQAAHEVSAVFTDSTGIPHSFASDDSSMPELQDDLSTWLSSENAGNTVVSSAARKTQDVTAPSYSNIAWTKIGEHTFYRQLASYCCNANLPGMGSYGVVTGVYRLNTADSLNDYFLVTTQFSQTPNWQVTNGQANRVGNTFFWVGWLNQYNNISSQLSAASTKGTLVDYAPQNKIKVTSTTLTVGQNSTFSVSANVSEKGGSIGGNYSQTNSASYSTTITQESVTTTATGTLGGPSASWADAADVEAASLPSTTIGTFNSARLAIFSLPRAIYNAAVPSVTVGFNLKPVYLTAYVDTTKSPGTQYAEADFISGDSFTMALPVFSVSKTSVSLKIGGSVTIPVTAKASGGYGITWGVGTLPNGVVANVDSRVGVTGNYSLVLAANVGAAPGTYFVYVNSIPPGSADSLRNGSIPIQVTITQ